MTLAVPSRRAIVLALCLAPVVAAACSTPGATCDCVDSAITVTIPADTASSVTSVDLSGTACTGVKPALTNLTNGGTEYSFTANAAGSCVITVARAGGTFTDTVTITQSTGCCAGFYATPLSAAQVDVPEPSGDAG